MANPVWPTTLPAPRADSADYAPLFDNIIKSSMEVGQKKRRRATYVPDTFAGSVILDAVQVATLLNFVDVTLKGVLPFDWVDWRTGEPQSYSFQTQPSFSLFSGTTDFWVAKLDLVTTL